MAPLEITTIVSKGGNMGKGGSKTDRNGFKIIQGKCSMHEMFDEPPVKNKPLVMVGPPASIIHKFKTAKPWHYPSKVLYKLQDGCCFFCGHGVADVAYSHSKPQGYRKACLHPRSEGYILWGNKVLAHAACHRQYYEEQPTREHLAKFDYLYGRTRFHKVFPEEARLLAKEGW